MTLLIIGIIVFAVGSYFDITYSEKVAAAGGEEFNPLERDHNKKFLPMKALFLHIGFAAGVLVLHFTVIPDDQKWGTGGGFIFVGIVSLIIAFAVNRPLYKKLTAK